MSRTVAEPRPRNAASQSALTAARKLTKGAHDSIGLGVVAGEVENSMRTQLMLHLSPVTRQQKPSNRDAPTEKRSGAQWSCYRCGHRGGFVGNCTRSGGNWQAGAPRGSSNIGSATGSTKKSASCMSPGSITETLDDAATDTRIRVRELPVNNDRTDHCVAMTPVPCQWPSCSPR